MEDLNSKQFSGGKNQLIAFVLFFFIIGLVWQLIRQRNIEKEGVFVIARVINTDTMKGGFLTRLKYHFNNHEYEATVRSKYGSESIGDAYFIKVLPGAPGGEIVYLENQSVPPCLLKVQMLSTGWKKIPDCP